MRRIFAAALPLCLIVLLALTAEAMPGRQSADGHIVSTACDNDGRCLPARGPTAREVSAVQDMRPSDRHSASLADAVPALAAKAREIVQDCGSDVVSVHRPGARVRGSGRPSLHARHLAEAVDLSGNPSCIYAHLRGWPGGVSTDYGRVHHVHFSLASDGREMGARFAHYSGKKKSKQRHARVRR